MAKKPLPLDTRLKEVLRAYRDSFSMKTYSEENDDPDPLMDVFGISPDRKRENRQYWGRELGTCWQLLVTNVLSHHCKEYAPAIKVGDDEPCDCCVAKDAIDTKYRIRGFRYAQEVQILRQTAQGARIPAGAPHRSRR